MENLRKRVDVKLVRSHREDKLRRLIASPAFARANIFDDDLAAIQVHKSRLVYVRISILDLSKHLIYDFYYNQLKTQYGESCQLLYTDTESRLLEIETEDVYKDMAQNQTIFDTSDTPGPPSVQLSQQLGSGKVERRVRRASNRRVCWPAPKMYSILEVGGKNTKKVKGVKKKKLIRHEQYKEALFENQTFRHGMDVLRSERHRIYGQYMNKVPLSPFDSKRWIAKNGVDTQAYGHRDVVCRWLVGCFGFNGLLRQYFSLYRTMSQREREREREEKG